MHAKKSENREQKMEKGRPFLKMFMIFFIVFIKIKLYCGEVSKWKK